MCAYRILARSHLQESDFYRRLQSEQADTSTFKAGSGEKLRCLLPPDDPLPSPSAPVATNDTLGVKAGEDKTEELEGVAGSSSGGQGDVGRRRPEWKMKHVMGGQGFVRSRRCNIILQFIRAHQVISNLVDLHKVKGDRYSRREVRG